MKDFLCKGLFIIIFSTFLLPSDSYTWPTGISQRTKKSSSLGCGGGCHSSGTLNSGFFTGPDTVLKGQSVQYTFTIIKSSSGKGGVDIAAFFGLLDTLGGGAYLKPLNQELVHKAGITFTSNSISINFLYIAPNFEGADTLYATLNVGYTGSWRWSPNKTIFIKPYIGIAHQTLPFKYELLQNYPNPFNPFTIISYNLKSNAYVNLDIFDINGRKITNLVDGFQTPGKYNVPFSISNYPLSSGIYYYRLSTENSSEVKSMMLVK